MIAQIIRLIPLSLLLFSSAFANQVIVESHGGLTDTESETLDIPKSRKFVYLTLGFDSEERTSNLPNNVKLKGDFEKITSAVYFKKTGKIHFSPKREGIGSLQILDKNNRKIAEYRVIVHKSRLDTVAREIQSLLGDVEGITIRILNNKVLVDGQVLLPSDMSRVLQVVEQFGEDNAVSLVAMSPVALQKMADLISREINNSEIGIRAFNDKLILSGWASSDDEKNNAEAIAKFYMPPVVADISELSSKAIQKRRPANDGIINLIKVRPTQPPPAPKMIQVVINYVELLKNYSKSFRFQFMPDIDDGSGMQITSGGNSSGIVTQFSATIKSLFPKLNWLKNHGYARDLQSGSILVKNKEKGSFTSETVMPTIQQLVGTNNSIASSGGQKFGIKSDVTPTLSGEDSDSVDLSISINISSVKGVSGGQPIIGTNTIDSKLLVRSTQSAAIGGFLSNVSTTDYNKLPPGVPRNPIISLYSSKEFNHGQSQFVVFVTPIIRNSADAEIEKIKKKFRIGK